MKPQLVSSTRSKTKPTRTASTVVSKARPDPVELDGGDQSRSADGVVVSYQSFMRDLSKLYRSTRTRDRWVLYAGRKRLGVGKSELELLQVCEERKLKPNQYYLGFVGTGSPDAYEGDLDLPLLNLDQSNGVGEESE